MTQPLDDRIRRGMAADRLLSDEIFLSAARAVDETIKRDMFATKYDETDKREFLYAESKGFQRVIERLRAWSADGKMAADELARNQ